jgi:hypothetical protein
MSQEIKEKEKAKRIIEETIQKLENYKKSGEWDRFLNEYVDFYYCEDYRDTLNFALKSNEAFIIFAINTKLGIGRIEYYNGIEIKKRLKKEIAKDLLRWWNNA